MMLSVLTWKWGTVFGPEYVNKLFTMLDRHLHLPYVMHCITDDPQGIDPRVVVHPMFYDHAEMNGGPRSCFRRLRMFDKDIADMIGPRILHLDLDVVLTDNCTSLFDRPEPLVIYREMKSSPMIYYNPSMLLMDAGVLHDMWVDFHADPHGVWQEAIRQEYFGSDMAVLGLYARRLDPPVWTKQDRVYSWLHNGARELPQAARVVLFYGGENPHTFFYPGGCSIPWIAEHWK